MDAHGSLPDRAADVDREVARWSAWAAGRGAVCEVGGEIGAAGNGGHRRFPAGLRDPSVTAVGGRAGRPGWAAGGGRPLRGR